MSTQIQKLNGLIATGTVIICRELNMSIFFSFSYTNLSGVFR